MDDVLGYAGRRVIVSGAASPIGTATIRILVDIGAEVHAIDFEKPDQPGLASFTEADLFDAEQVDRAVDRIGRVVNSLFNCADVSEHLIERVVPLMIDGASIASMVAAGAGPFDAQLVGNSSATGIRLNGVTALHGGEAEDHAWALVFLNSPRLAGVTGAVIGPA